MPLALLFDLDGTMVDTDHLHIAAWNDVLAPDGRRIDPVFYRTSIMGFDNGSATRLAPDLARLPITHNRRAFGLAKGVRAALSVSVIIAASEYFDIPLLREAALAALCRSS